MLQLAGPLRFFKRKKKVVCDDVRVDHQTLTINLLQKFLLKGNKSETAIKRWRDFSEGQALLARLNKVLQNQLWLQLDFPSKAAIEKCYSKNIAILAYFVNVSFYGKLLS